jgi:hypothetical protein
MELMRLLEHPTQAEYLAVLVATNIPIAYGITTKPGSFARYLIPILILPSCYWIFEKAHLFNTSNFFNGTLGSCSILYFLGSNILLWIRPYQTTFISAISITPLFGPRLIGTPLQVKGVPNRPAYYGKVGKNKGPSRVTFLIRQTSIFLWLYLATDMVTFQADQQTAEERQKLFGPPGKEWEFEFTAEHIISRIMFSLISWFIGARCILSMFYAFFSLVSVGTGLSTPSQWPPFMGRVSQSYTVRKFWGSVSHYTPEIS